jgi:hypothetical protein
MFEVHKYNFALFSLQGGKFTKIIINFIYPLTFSR